MIQLQQHTINTPYMVGPVHCYSGNLAGDLVLFDTGPPTAAAKEYLTENLDLKRLKYVLISHCHIDHYGQASWLEKEYGATIFLPYRDALKLQKHIYRMKQMYELLLGLGFGEKYLSKLREIFESGSLFPPAPQDYRVVEDELPEELGIEVLQCPGHSQSDVVYTSENWAVTGDTLLRGVFQSPLLDVDLETGDRFSNYRAYCDTLKKLAALEGRTILPGHRKNIGSIPEVLGFYVSKLLLRARQVRPFRNEENLELLLQKVLGGREQEIFNMYLKGSEIMFMKDFLVQPDLLKNALISINLFDSVKDLYSEAICP